MRYALILFLFISTVTFAEGSTNKSPVPCELDLIDADRLVDEIFGDQIKEARDEPSKSMLAIKLLSTAANTRDQFEKYALLERAQILALEANDLQTCFRTVEAIANLFQIDKIETWDDLLVDLMKRPVDKTTIYKLAKIDVQASDDPAKRADAADAWFLYSKSLKGPLAQVAKDRAMLHYQAAMSNLVGLKKIKAQKRLEACRATGSIPKIPRNAGHKTDIAQTKIRKTSKPTTPSRITPSRAKRTVNLDCTKGLSIIEAKKAQRNAAKACHITVEVRNKIGMRFRLIPPGIFIMGSLESETNRDVSEKQHVVTVSQPFYMSMAEVTQLQYWQVVGKTPSHFKGKENHPVEMVNWHAAKEFCKKLSELDKDHTYQLPTMAQWEYACRAGTLGPTYGPMNRIAWCQENGHKQTQMVGQLAPNAWGLYDCLGNVWEQCSDSNGQILGGSWKDNIPSGHLRAARRLKCSPNDARNNIGFRVILTLEP